MVSAVLGYACALWEDNGVMVAWATIERLRLGCSDAPSDLEVRARWPLGVAHVPAPPAGGAPSAKQRSPKHTKHTKLASTRVVAPEPPAGVVVEPAPPAVALPWWTRLRRWTRL
ncbi:hypothetical protein T484DRAFT_1896229 [Baffinella frigidus]|nr:hypothetical protein T484DRAFT_1896229 [Cryptophyta sp. CCMP2293]